MRTCHKWSYIHEQQPDEATIFMHFESEDNGGTDDLIIETVRASSAWLFLFRKIQQHITNRAAGFVPIAAAAKN